MIKLTIPKKEIKCISNNLNMGKQLCANIALSLQD
jgi:hypothetical protein